VCFETFSPKVQVSGRAARILSSTGLSRSWWTLRAAAIFLAYSRPTLARTGETTNGASPRASRSTFTSSAMRISSSRRSFSPVGSGLRQASAADSRRTRLISSIYRTMAGVSGPMVE
jgi:hypothetical protein